MHHANSFPWIISFDVCSYPLEVPTMIMFPPFSKWGNWDLYEFAQGHTASKEWRLDSNRICLAPEPHL